MSEIQNIHLIAKRTYNEDKPIYLKRYLIIDDNVRFAALRFYNSADFTVHGIAFTIKQMGANGVFISENKMEFGGLSILPQNEFPVPDIELNSACTEIEITINKVYSGNYEYVVEENGMRANYLPDIKHRHGYYVKPAAYKGIDRSKRMAIMLVVFVVVLFILTFLLTAFIGAINKGMIINPFEKIFERATDYVKK